MWIRCVHDVCCKDWQSGPRTIIRPSTARLCLSSSRNSKTRNCTVSTSGSSGVLLVLNVLGRFDQIMCLECIEHIPNDRKLVSDLASLLAPTGVLIISTPYKYHKATIMK